ncbi:tetratricopeptide repeat protein [Planctomycetota bacterium]
MPGSRVKTKTKITRCISICLLLCVCLVIPLNPTFAQTSSQVNPEKLFSPSVGLDFYEIAYELTNLSNTTQLTQYGQNATDTNTPRINQALIFLSAVRSLDKAADYVLADMLRIITRYQPDGNYTSTETDPWLQLVYQLISAYNDESADFLVLKDAVQYLLDNLNTREEREKLLQQLLINLGNKNSRFDSYLATKLGLLMAEKTDVQSATPYLLHAYNKNNYNNAAFSKLTELAPEQIHPAFYLKQLRLILCENPFELTAALDFAQYAEQLQLYQTAADAYQYSADLFAYLNPSEPLPPRIYLPWALSCYHTDRNRHKCLEIAEDIRKIGRLDLLLEAITAKAAEKIPGAQKADEILQSAEENALRLLIENIPSGAVDEAHLAWFYCFGTPQPAEALDWANKAFSTDPNSPAAASLLAYALVLNGQTDWAQTIIKNYAPSQISDLVLAQIQIRQQNNEAAIENLKLAIAKDPASLEAELAKQMLAELGGQYIPAIDPALTLNTLKEELEIAVVPKFTTPPNLISVQISTRGSKFYYANKFSGYMVITNNSSQPLVVSGNSLFRGFIRVDADITGDLNKSIPKLVTTRVMPSSPIPPGRNLLIPLRLTTEELRRILLEHPQASFNIEFTAYMDPVTTPDGRITNRIHQIKPAKTTVKRPGVELTGKYLRNRFDSLTKGQQGQKMQTAELFIGLLKEQNVMANRRPLYEFMYADWMPELLKSALIYNLTDKDWVLKTHTMAQMLSLPLDYELTTAAAENLNDTHWPARLMALYLLANKQGNDFEKVLDWVAEHDENNLVRSMAIALGATPPQREAAGQQQEDTPQPPVEDSTQLPD